MAGCEPAAPSTTMASLDWECEDEKIVGDEEGIKSKISSDVREDPNGTCLTRSLLTNKICCGARWWRQWGGCAACPRLH